MALKKKLCHYPQNNKHICLALICLAVLSLCVARAGYGQDQPLQLMVGEIKTLSCATPHRIAIGNPAIIDITILSGTEIMLRAKAKGTTDLVIWDEGGMKSISVKVLTEDMDKVAAGLKELLGPIKGISMKVEEDKIFLVGEVGSPTEAEGIKGMVASFPQVVNLVKARERQPLVHIDVEVLEVSTDDLERIGIDWADSANAQLSGLIWPKTDTTFTIGIGTSNLVATLNLLITEGKIRTLSRPNLMTVSGKEAELLVGGEIPVVTVETTAEGIVPTVEYREYGIRLKIKPTVIEEDVIATTIEAEVSDIDSANNVVLAGVSVPAFSERSAKTEVHLKNGQTVLIGGLLKDKVDETITRVPFLSKIPVLGELFKSKQYTKGETELIIAVTPFIIREKEEVQEVLIEKAEVKDTKLAYFRLIQQRISQALTYPRLAMENGWEGEVLLNLNILPDGSLKGVVIANSSGIEALDQAAVVSVERQAPYPPFPPEMELKDLEVDIPIVYELSGP